MNKKTEPVYMTLKEAIQSTVRVGWRFRFKDRKTVYVYITAGCGAEPIKYRRDTKGGKSPAIWSHLAGTTHRLVEKLG